MPINSNVNIHEQWRSQPKHFWGANIWVGPECLILGE